MTAEEKEKCNRQLFQRRDNGESEQRQPVPCIEAKGQATSQPAAEKRTVELSEEAALCIALCDCVHQKREAMSEAKISSCECKVSGGESVKLTLNVKAEENIAVLVPVEVSTTAED